MILPHLILDLTQRRSLTNLWEQMIWKRTEARDDIRDLDPDDEDDQPDALPPDCPFSYVYFYFSLRTRVEMKH